MSSLQEIEDFVFRAEIESVKEECGLETDEEALALYEKYTKEIRPKIKELNSTEKEVKKVKNDEVDKDFISENLWDMNLWIIDVIFYYEEKATEQAEEAINYIEKTFGKIEEIVSVLKDEKPYNYQQIIRNIENIDRAKEKSEYRVDPETGYLFNVYYNEKGEVYYDDPYDHGKEYEKEIQRLKAKEFCKMIAEKEYLEGFEKAEKHAKKCESIDWNDYNNFEAFLSDVDVVVRGMENEQKFEEFEKYIQNQYMVSTPAQLLNLVQINIEAIENQYKELYIEDDETDNETKEIVKDALNEIVENANYTIEHLKELVNEQ